MRALVGRLKALWKYPSSTGTTVMRLSAMAFVLLRGRGCLVGAARRVGERK